MKKVIIPDNLRAIIERERSLFNRSDVKVFAAASNRKALELHRAKNADLIILNLDTPDMSGETLCSLIREDETLRHVSLIVVCSGAEEDLERCTQCRANAFVTNPVNPAVLAEEAQQLLHVAPRNACRIPFSIEFEGTSDKTSFIGSIENLSTSGMFFRSAAELFEGDAITCSFTLPGSRRITVDAEIVRTLRREKRRVAKGYGAKFTDIGGSSFSAIKAFLSEHDAQNAGSCAPGAPTFGRV